MIRGEATDRSRGWLEEQLEGLRRLRNATSRDPIFKHWRQSTLTVLQRIWPTEPARSERFRRIAFSPPGSRTESAIVREYYSHGCQEASSYLKELLAEVSAHGVSESEPPAERDLSLPQGEDDFPTVELPSAEARALHGPDAGDNDIVLDLGGPSPESPLSPEPRAEDAGMPPRLKIDAKSIHAAFAKAQAAAAAPGIPSVPVVADVPGDTPVASPPAPAAEPAAASAEKPRNGRNGKTSRRNGMKQRLKDMLGLSHLTAPIPEDPEVSEPIAQAEAVHEPPAESVSESPVAPAPATAPNAQVESGVITTKPSKKQRGKAVVLIESLISAEFRDAPAMESTPTPEAPVEPEATVAPVAEALPIASELPEVDPTEEKDLDPEEFARATVDFLKNSPVLGLVGKPVQRQKDDCDLLEPDAVAIWTLAADVARLGVPEGRRAAARAMLLDLARHIEAKDADWATLRSTVNFAMEFPELARRLVPVLLPWLDRAA